MEDFGAEKITDGWVEQENANSIEDVSNEEKSPQKEQEPIVRVDKYFDKASRKFRYKRTAESKNLAKKFSRYVVVVITIFSSRGVPEGIEVLIRGDILCEILNAKIMHTSIPNIRLSDPLTDPQLQFFYHERSYLRQQLEEAKSIKEGLMDNDPECERVIQRIFQLESGIKFIEDHYSETAKTRKGLKDPANIIFSLLWTIFQPGMLVYITNPLGDGWVLRVQFCMEIESQLGQPPQYRIYTDYIDYDGKKYGYTYYKVYNIQYFPDEVAISSLSIYPFDYHPRREEEKERILKRTEKALRNNDIHSHMYLQEYSGTALCHIQTNTSDSDDYGQGNRVKEAKFRSHGRVIIDPLSYDEFRPSNTMIPIIVTPLCREMFKETEKLLFSPVQYGFSLGDQTWGAFSIAHLEDVAWRPASEIVDSLIIPNANKDFLMGVVEAHAVQEREFDDIVRDKGKSLIGLFTGPPGVGKTITAEIMAEVAHKPLYILGSGELGDQAAQVQKHLENVLELSSRWGAVLLLDEADVFLTKRDDKDLNRNAITSIFLRKLEYYHGILILTTNRVESIDEAFRSRIHILIEYPNLDQFARNQLWEVFLTIVRDLKQKVNISSEEMRLLSLLKLNGRQIKNITRIAQAYATRKNEEMTLDTIQKALLFSGWPAQESLRRNEVLPLTKRVLFNYCAPMVFFTLCFLFILYYYPSEALERLPWL